MTDKIKSLDQDFIFGEINTEAMLYAEIKRLRSALTDCLFELRTYGCDEQGEYMHTVKETIERTEKILNEQTPHE